MIGFVPASYSVGEGDGFVSLVVEIISGSLSVDVVVSLDFSDEQAISKKHSITDSDNACLLKLYK